MNLVMYTVLCLSLLHPSLHASITSDCVTCIFEPFAVVIVCSAYFRVSHRFFVADGLKHWSVTADGGDQFLVEPDKCPGSESVGTIGIRGKSYMCSSIFWHFLKVMLISIVVA